MNFTPSDASEENTKAFPRVFNPCAFGLPVEEAIFQKIARLVETEENIKYSFLEVVFVDEAQIVKLNRKYLNREYITDILSFRYDENESLSSIEGGLYCCAPRIAEQAAEFGTGQAEEFQRVFIHGLLHLAGYDDQTGPEKEEMTRLENHYLSRLEKT